jgi:antitoxin MazE
MAESATRSYNVHTAVPKTRPAEGTMALRTKIVKIGNSQGVRIPKPLLEQTGLTGEVELNVDADRIVIQTPRRHPREGWEEQFRAAAAQGDDVPFDGDEWPPTEFDKNEWEW